MSSFNSPHYLYLFEMRNGRKKLAYGSSPEDAYEGLRIRLSEREMKEILKDPCTRITQRDLRQHIKELG